MNQTVSPGPRTGSVRIPASKSQAHRLLICAALGAQPVSLRCDGVSADIAATARCLSALGADITDDGAGTLRIVPIAGEMPAHADLFCGESGSTLRFLLPVVGALGADVTFHMEGRLPERPLSPLDAVLTAHGMTIRRDGALLHAGGRLRPGAYALPGDVSSQYISGLLMALPRLPGESTLAVTGRLESAGYIAMTEDALHLSGIRLQKRERTYTISGGQTARLPARCHVEGDWSNAAFFLCMGALSPAGVTVTGLASDSSQGDRAVLDVLRRFGADVRETQDAVTVRRGALRGVDRQRRPPAAQGVRPAREHGRHAARARRAGGGARQRPDRHRPKGAHRRHGRPAARPPHRHGGGGRRQRQHRARHGARLRMYRQILPPLLDGSFRAENRSRGGKYRT